MHSQDKNGYQPDDRDLVILVDENDQVVGTAEKMAAHLDGSLHRAFSVFLYNAKGEILLQRRALDKYHSAGLWSNTCCSHPRPNEDVEAAARRRLFEEMGIESKLRKVFAFTYRTTFPSGLSEHEYDHVLIGRFDGTPDPDASEVAEWRWANPAALAQEMQRNPEDYTYWFRIAIEHVVLPPLN